MLSVALLFEVRQDYDGWREGKRHTHTKKKAKLQMSSCGVVRLKHLVDRLKDRLSIR